MSGAFVISPLDIAVLVGILLFSLIVDFKGHKDGHEMTVKESVGWSLFFVVIAFVYFGYIWLAHGQEFASMFLAGYVLEKSLSVDNLIVFTAIFASFGIKTTSLQHKILLWGIAGAIVFRGIFVAAGTSLFHLHWTIQVLFGLLVIWSAWMMLKGSSEEEEVDYSKHSVVKWVGKVYPVFHSLDGNKLFTFIDGVKHATPALLCIAVIELTDVMFSFDSVPAVISVTQEPLLVYSAMLFAILGLRALYFVLSVALKYLVHLEKAVIFVLVFVGGKLMFHALNAEFNFTNFDISVNHSLFVVLGALGLGVVASFVFPEKEEV